MEKQGLTKKQIAVANTQKKEKDYYEKSKRTVFKHFFTHHLPVSVIIGSGRTCEQKDFRRTLALAEKYDKVTYMLIKEHDKNLSDFYNNELDEIIEILLENARTIESDPTAANKLIYLLNYHDLVSFSYKDFEKLVNAKKNDSELKTMIMRDKRNADFLSTGLRLVSRNSFDNDGNLVFFSSEKSAIIRQFGDKQITSEDYRYCFEKLVENDIPLLNKIVDEAVKAHAGGKLDELINTLLENRHILKEEQNLENTSVSVNSAPKGKAYTKKSNK